MTELVLIVSDLFIPLRNPDIDAQFKSILVPNKVQHVLCLGNIGNQETFDWINSLSGDFHLIKGDYDINRDLPEKKVVQIGNFRIGMIHGHQIVPIGDLEILAGVQRELDCDLLVSGYTHQLSVNVKENKLYVNPGSISGALSPLMEDSYPSFILMALQGDELTIYSYVLTDKNQKFEVSQMEYFRGTNELKIIKEIGEENNNKENINNENENNKEIINNENENNKENINNENNSNNQNNFDNQNKENEEKKNLEKEQSKQKEEKEEKSEPNELIQNNNPNLMNENQNEERKEVKKANNEDEKIDE